MQHLSYRIVAIESFDLLEKRVFKLSFLKNANLAKSIKIDASLIERGAIMAEIKNM